MKDMDNAKSGKLRGFQTNKALPYHTDGCDIFCLLCLTQGRKGGKTSIVSAVHVFNTILKTRPEVARTLQEPFHFDARGQRPDGKRCQVHPIYSYHAGRLFVLNKEPYILSAQRFEDVPRLTPKQKEALKVFRELTEQKGMSVELDLEPGDMIVCTNHSLVHGRTAFEDDQAAGTAKRHLLRLWLTSKSPKARELPPHYADTREYALTYKRRMVGPGTSTNAVGDDLGSFFASPSVVVVLVALAVGLLDFAGGQAASFLIERAALLLWIPNSYWLYEGSQWLAKGIPSPKSMEAAPNFSGKSLFLLCFSESFSMVACAMILRDLVLSHAQAVLFCVITNAVGYAKYVYQMFFDLEYITLSFHIYTASWLVVSAVTNDPIYFFLFRYPFHLLTGVEQYINMKGRKILYDELSISLHVVDHLLHGLICCRVLLYHWHGAQAFVWDALFVPFVVLLSENMVRMQIKASPKEKTL